MVAGLGVLLPDHCAYFAFVARREHVESGALEDAELLRSLRFDASLLLPFGYWIDELLRPLDLTTDDLDIVNVPSPAAVEALANGTIDVTINSEPFVSMSAASDEVVIWQDVAQVVPDYPVSAMMYGPSMLDGSPEIGERFATAMLKAMRQFRQGKSGRNVEIVEQATGLSRAQVVDACWPVMREDGWLDPAVFRGYQEWSVAHGLVDRVLADDELFDRHFMQRANEALAR